MNPKSPSLVAPLVQCSNNEAKIISKALKDSDDFPENANLVLDEQQTVK